MSTEGVAQAGELNELAACLEADPAFNPLTNATYVKALRDAAVTITNRRAGGTALREALERARVILDNMAKENPPRIAFGFQRWPVHHEPLRNDARNLLPAIDAALAAIPEREVGPNDPGIVPEELKLEC